MSSENQEVVTPEVETDNTVLSGDPKTETPETSTDWKTSLPEDIRADKSLENIKDIEGLAKSYVYAQKMVGSDKIPVPNKYATEDDWNAVYEKLGRPKDATGYKYELGDNVNINQDALKNFSDQAHKLGLLPTQANGIVKFYNNMAAQQQQDLDTTSENARQESETSLKKEWGQAYKQQTIKAANIATQVFDDEFLDKNLADGTKIGDHPAFIKAFATLADKMGEDNITQASGPAYQTPSQIEKEIGELTKTGSSYWDKRHPNHELAVNEVLNLRKQKNNEV